MSSEHFACRGGGDAAAYALGALDDGELDGFRRHLQTCSVCQADVQSLQQLTDVLGMSASQYPAPRGLRRRVMADVRADARRQLAARRVSDRRDVGGLSVGRLSAGGGLRAGLGLGAPRRAGLVGAGAALVLVLVVVLVGLTVSNSNRTTTHVYRASVGTASVVVSGGHGELIVHRLKQLTVAQTYEVWEKRSSGSPQPTNVLFNVSATGDSAVSVPGSMQGVREIMVTKEPSGGRVKPTTPAVVVVPHIS